MGEGKRDGDTYNVSSANQTGGFTVGKMVVNVKPKRTLVGRHVPDEISRRLMGRSVSSVSIDMFNPDSEAQDFATEIFGLVTQHLRWPVASQPNMTMTPDRFHGVGVETVADVDANDPLQAFAAWLQSQGFSTQLTTRAPQNKIVIGPQG